jgi:hypothetical protein
MALVGPSLYTTCDEFLNADRTFHDPIHGAVSSIKAVGSFAAFGSVSPGATCSIIVEGVGPFELPPTAADVAALDVPEPFMEFHEVLQGSIRFHEIPLGFVRFHEVLWDSMRFYEVL